MWIQIGTRPRANDDDVVASLLACHERIRRFCDLAARIASDATAEPAEVASAAEMVGRYFAVALPLHAADEELGLRPALLAHVTAPELERDLETMASEHRLIDELLEGLLPRWSRLASEPAARASVAAESAADTARLRGIFDEHLAREETSIFPAVARLGVSELSSIRAGMRLRRGAKP